MSGNIPILKRGFLMLVTGFPHASKDQNNRLFLTFTLIHQPVPYMQSLSQLHAAARRYPNSRTTVFGILAEYEVGGIPPLPNLGFTPL